MAKLNVVIPAADVEVIGKDGARTKYRKVDRDAKRGDIIKITDNDDSSYVIEDAFYTVEYLDGADDPQILDEDGDEYDASHMEYEVYEKVTEPVASIPDEVAFEGTKYRRVVRSAEEGDVILITELADEDDALTVGELYRVESIDWAGDPQITDDDGEDFDTCGTSYKVYERVAVLYREEQKQLYKEVKRPAKVGERIKIVSPFMTTGSYGAGDILTVRTPIHPGNWINVVFAEGVEVGISHDEYVVLEPIDSAQPTQPKRLTVGDYAKVIADQTTSDDDPISNGARVGDIVKVVEVDDSRVPYRVETVAGANVGDTNWAREWALEYVDKAEFQAQKTFKVGDYVKVTDASGASGIAKVGDIGEITNENWSGGPIGDQTIIEIKTLDGREYGMYAHRFVRATEAEVEAAKQALKYGDFTDGDYAQIVNATKDNANDTAIENADKFVKVTRDIGGYRGLALRLPDGGFAGYANADALRKVTREEYEAAVDPRSKFAKGDKVRLISGGGQLGLFDYETGGIYTVNDPKPDNTFEKVQITGGGQPTAYAKPDQLEKVSAEEFAEIEKWRAIGRKVGEYKRGDIVSIIKKTGVKGVGTVEDAFGPGNNIGVRMSAKTWDGSPFYGVYIREGDSAELIVPVEQRFDREQDGTAQAA